MGRTWETGLAVMTSVTITIFRGDTNAISVGRPDMSLSLPTGNAGVGTTMIFT